MTPAIRQTYQVTHLTKHLISITGGNSGTTGGAAGIDLVTRATTFSFKEVTSDNNGRWSSEQKEVSLAKRLSDQEVITFAGFRPRIERLLFDAGFAIEFVNYPRVVHSNIADPGVVQRLSTMNQHLVQLIISNVLLRLCIRSDSEIINHLELISRLFPHAEIVILARTERQSSKIRRELRKRLGQPVRRGGDLNGDIDARITVGPSTKKTLSLISMPIILVVLDVDDLLSRRGQQILESQNLLYRFDRIIGFQSDIKQRPHLEMYREAIFGPKRYSTPRRRHKVLVAYAQAPQQDELPHADALERKCRRIWCSGVRNDRVASLASAIALGQIWKLERSGIHSEVIQYLSRSNTSVVVLVENVVHAQELQRRLPGWTILAKEDSSPSAPSQDGNIVTVAYADHYGLDAGFIILAAGGVDSVPRLWLRPTEGNGRKNRVIIIDLDDVPAVLGRQPHVRRLHHQQQGYQVFDPSPASHDAD
jgi:hypothetical protein